MATFLPSAKRGETAFPGGDKQGWQPKNAVAQGTLELLGEGCQPTGRDYTSTYNPVKRFRSLNSGRFVT
jgi:hypothetical protein